jgi:hypothetical protein
MRETAASSYLPIMQLVNQRPQALSRKPGRSHRRIG